MGLNEIASTADALLALEPDELGLRLLPILARPTTVSGEVLSLYGFLERQFMPIHYAFERQVGNSSPYSHEQHNALKDALAEAWAWLEGQGLIVPRLEAYRTAIVEFHPTNRRLSRRGLRLAREPRLALATRQLPKDALHPLIREDVWVNYHRGKYDTAVFEAMKVVEIRVRKAAGLAATDLGTDLMRKAFNPQNGPLTDTATPMAEREARSALFAGAIGSYKNPQSHRHVDLDDPDETAEIIMLANHLLRIVDAREAVQSA